MEAEATRCALTERSCDGLVEGATFEVCRTSYGMVEVLEHIVVQIATRSMFVGLV